LGSDCVHKALAYAKSLPSSRHDKRVRSVRIRLGVLPQTLLTTRSLVPERISWQAIRSIWIGIDRPNRLCERDSEKKF